MDQLITLIQIAATSGLVVAPIVAFVKLLTWGLRLDDIQPLRFVEPGWPIGVQEEDVPRFRVERARARRALSSTPPRSETPASPRTAQGCELAPSS